MREINSVQRRLEWVQPGALKMYYELRSDNELIATWVSEAYWARSRPRTGFGETVERSGSAAHEILS